MERTYIIGPAAVAALQQKLTAGYTEAAIDDIEAIRTERDFLARKVKSLRSYVIEQDRRIRSMSAGALSADTAIDALRKRADDDGALHFDAIREVLIGLGARP